MVVNAPERSLEQRRDALDKANYIRTWRADLKVALKKRGVHFHELLMDPPDEILNMKLYDFCLALPKFGRVKVNKILMQCRISPSKTVGGLSERQRNEIARLLRR